MKNIKEIHFGTNSLKKINEITSKYKGYKLFFIDIFFKEKNILGFNLSRDDKVIYIDTQTEPTTEYINSIIDYLLSIKKNKPILVVSIGGGSTLDTGKAIANLLTNPGNAEDYQGWDLVKNPAIYKIGIPTISGTGAEASRTCVMTNPKNGLKLGMNSDFTIYDQLILDPNLTKTVPKEQYFYTGMDTYLHCIESLNGKYRNAVGDAFSQQAITLCREVFLSDDMMSDENREKLMVASYLGGCAIANSFVGIVHPFSAGLSVVLDSHHCISNCIAMNAMEEFYPKEYEEFKLMAEKQKVTIPKGIASNLDDESYLNLYNSTIIHEKPLSNALGNCFKDTLTLEKTIEIFKKM